MAKYRKKSAEIEAVQFFPNMECMSKLYTFLPFRVLVFSNDNKKYIIIPTLEGNMLVSEGDYIVKDRNGEFYPCKLDIFEKNYEFIED